MATVTIYTRALCGYCWRAPRLLRKKGVAFEERDTTGDAATRAWLARVTGRTTVPQVFINGRSVGGFSDLAALEKAGGLDPLLAEAPAEGAPALPR